MPPRSSLPSYTTPPLPSQFLARVTSVIAGTPQSYEFAEVWLRGDGTWDFKTGGRIGTTDNPGLTLPASDDSEVFLFVDDFAWVRSADGAAGLLWEMTPIGQGDSAAFLAVLTTSSSGVWKWKPYSLDSSGVYQLGTESLTYNAVPSTIDGSIFASAPASGLRVWMRLSDTLTAGGDPQYEFLPIGVFAPSGTNHSAGLVPDPGSMAGTTKFLREDATWAVPNVSSGGVLLKTGSYSITDADRGKLISFDFSGGTGTATIPDPSGSNFDSTWLCALECRSGTLTLARGTSSTIDGAASLTIPTAQGVWLFSDGTNYETERGLAPTIIAGTGITVTKTGSPIGSTITISYTGGPAPSAPTSPSTGTLTTTTIPLSWTAPTGVPPAATYTVYSSLSSSMTSPVLVGSGIVATSTTATGLTPATHYYFGIVAVSSLGAVSPYSAIVDATTISAPTVGSLSVTSGSTAGGDSTTITGTGFITGAVANFGGVDASVTTFTNSTTLGATTPAHAAGAVTVKVTNTDTGNGSLASGFTFVSPPPPPGPVRTPLGAWFDAGGTVTESVTVSASDLLIVYCANSSGSISSVQYAGSSMTLVVNHGAGPAIQVYVAVGTGSAANIVATGSGDVGVIAASVSGLASKAVDAFSSGGGTFSLCNIGSGGSIISNGDVMLGSCFLRFDTGPTPAYTSPQPLSDGQTLTIGSSFVMYEGYWCTTGQSGTTTQTQMTQTTFGAWHGVNLTVK